jgi:molecular chaperone IbpA
MASMVFGLKATLSGGCDMRSIDLSPYARSTIGFDHLFSVLQQDAEAATGYPPYNIERSDETHYRITVAVAGFCDKDLDVEVHDGVLTVAGKTEEQEDQNYLYRGIAGRQFTRRFQLAEHVEVRSARLENGLLHIDLERLIPEEKKPRRITINAPELSITNPSRAA